MKVNVQNFITSFLQPLHQLKGYLVWLGNFSGQCCKLTDTVVEKRIYIKCNVSINKSLMQDLSSSNSNSNNYIF